MESIKKILLNLIVLLFYGISSNAVVARLVIDKKSISAVSANTAVQSSIEIVHNKTLEEILKKQDKIKSYTATMESIKELYRMSMQNINGFGEESAYYKQMVDNFLQIPGNTARAVKAINRCPGINYINSLNEIVDIQTDVVGLVEKFIDIVNNGKVDFSAFTSGKSNDKLSVLLQNAHLGKGDGYNFLDRYQRLTLANELLAHIMDINIRLNQIVYICEYCRTFSNFMYNIDPLTWATYFQGTNMVQSVINDWKYEMHS